MRHLLAWILVLTTIALAAVPQQDPGEDVFAWYRGRALEGFPQPIHVYISYPDDVGEVKHDRQEIRDRIHLAFMRGDVRFRETLTSSVPGSEVAIWFHLSTERIFDEEPFYFNNVTVSLSEEVTIVRKPEIRLLVHTYSDSRDGAAGSAAAKDQMLSLASQAATRFVAAYNANNRARDTVD